MPDNVLYYGDNLDVLRRHIKDESVDLLFAGQYAPIVSNRVSQDSGGAQNGAPA